MVCGSFFLFQEKQNEQGIQKGLMTARVLLSVVNCWQKNVIERRLISLAKKARAPMSRYLEILHLHDFILPAVCRDLASG